LLNLRYFSESSIASDAQAGRPAPPSDPHTNGEHGLGKTHQRDQEKGPT
jgi:hypothetical protein